MSLKHLVAGLVIALTAIGPATAQDWSGRTIGLQLGHVSGSPAHTRVIPAGRQGHEVSADGITFGLSYGHTWQRGRLVFGIDGDLAVSDAAGRTVRRGGGNAPCGRGRGGCDHAVNALATVQGRLGFALENGILPYVTGGLAVADVSATASIGRCGATPCTVDGIETGYTVGFGIEVPVPDRWSLRSEVSRVDLGTVRFDRSTNPAGNRFIETDLSYTHVSIGFHRRF
ncbi:outer membrane protein [Jannaschia sp. KMU-145]|uniref:outer membrane protein n=1 Tax=Jannaschia halovivens TaxID=3388667 RepID=UPI00396B4562